MWYYRVKLLGNSVAIRRSQNWINQQRVDVPHLRSIESAVRNDFDELFTALVTGESQSYVIRGMELEMAGSIGASANGLQLVVANSSILHGKSDEAGTFFNVATGTPNQVLSATTNTKVDGAFTPAALNYVSIEFVRQVDDTTTSQVYLWNPTTNTEITKTLPLAETLDYKIVISSSNFGANVLPIAIVETDSSNNVLSIQDRRPQLFSTGTAGSATPDPFYEYGWAEGRTPNFWSSSSSSTSPFQGGDKQIQNFKDNDLAIKTEIKLMKGTQYWSSPNIGGSISGLRYDLGNTILTGRGSISHDAGDPGLVNWDEDIFLTVLSTRLKYKLEANDATTDINLDDKQVAYIKIIRNVNIIPQLIFTNGADEVTSVGAIAWTSNLEAGDFIKVASEEDTSYYQILSIDSASQVTLTENFGGTSTGILGTDAKYAWGNYRTDAAPSTDRHIKVANVEDMPFDADTFWLFFRDDNSGISRIYLRFLNAELKQGETITIADQVPAAVLAYMGSSSDVDADPNYSTLATSAKTGTENYNAVQGENLTVRASKLTSMVADKAQDKTIKLVSDHTSITNTTNSTAQEITMSGGSGAADVIIPSSANNGTIGTSGTLSLEENQAAYYVVDRNAAFSVANLGVLTVAAISSIPLDENTFIFAYRLAGTTVYLWNGEVLATGTSILLSTLRGYVQDNKTVKLIKGGAWSWDSALNELTNSATAYIQLAGLAENVNEIAAQTISLTADGQCAYVTLKRTAGASTLTVTVAAIASVPKDDHTFIIARRVGNDVLVDNFKLINGQSSSLGDVTTQETLSYIGATDINDSDPNYTSNIRGVVNESLVTRVSVLTDVVGDYQEDRSTYLRSNGSITWTGTQISFSTDIVLEIVNTKTGTTTVHTIAAAASPINLANNESAWVSIDRTTSGAITVNESGTTAIPAQTQVGKDVFVLFKRVDNVDTSQQELYSPFLKTLIQQGQSVRLGAAGGGSGGGGGLDVYYTDNFESVGVSNYVTGNDAAFMGGGALVGTLVDEAISPISGDTSLSYTQALGSLNDYFASELIDVDFKQQNNDSGMTFYFTYDGDDNDLKFVVYDVTNSAELTSGVELVKTESTARRYALSFYIPPTCTQIRWGAQVLVENVGAALKMDDVEITSNPFVYKDLIDSPIVAYYTSDNGQVIDSSFSAFIYEDLVEDTNGDYNTSTGVYTFSKSGHYDIEASIKSANASSWVAGDTFSISIYKNNAFELASQFIRISDTASYGLSIDVNVQKYFEAGDTVEIRAQVSVSSTVTAETDIRSNYFSVVKLPESTEHVITPAKSTLTDWEAFTPTGSWTTNTTYTGYRKRIGDFLQVKTLAILSGAPDATDFSIDPPEVPDESKLIISSGASTYSPVGTAFVFDSSTGSNRRIGLVVYNISTDSFSVRVDNPDTATLVNSTHPITFTSSDFISLEFSYPVEGWSSDVTLLAAIPTPKTAYIKDIKPSSTNGGTFTSGAWQTRDLTTLEGDTGFVSLSSNQFTLQPGKYEIVASAPAYQVVEHKIKLRNITDSEDSSLGTNARSGSASDAVTRSELNSIITITSSKTFEIQHRCTSTFATSGFGSSIGISDEVYTQVSIKKVG